MNSMIRLKPVQFYRRTLILHSKRRIPVTSSTAQSTCCQQYFQQSNLSTRSQDQQNRLRRSQQQKRLRPDAQQQSQLGNQNNRKAAGNNANSNQTINSRNQDQNQNKKRAKNLSVQDATRQMKEILAQTANITPLPSIFDDLDYESIPTDDYTRRLKLMVATKDLFESLIETVNQGGLNPAGKHGKDLSKFLELVMWVYTLTPPLNSVSVFQHCQHVLDAIQKWNLNMGQSHYESAVLIAAREQKWKEAAALFLDRIDPEAGQNPVDINISNPVGLYAIAKLAQEQGTPATPQVFDAVRCMQMVASRDQSSYVLSAGIALGHAGEGLEALSILESEDAQSEFGKDLISSLMYACIMSGRQDKALELFETTLRNPNHASGGLEWQWGGTSDRIDPLFRDLALRAMGTQRGISAAAVELFQQTVDDGFPMTTEALIGVLKSCENDNKWEDAVSVFMTTLGQRQGNTPWLVPANSMLMADSGNIKNYDTEIEGIPDEDLADIIASTVRTCNSSSKFGMAMFCIRLLDLYLSETHLNDEQKHEHGGFSPIEASLWNVMGKTTDPQQLLVPIMASLCSLRCHVQAFLFYDKLVERELIVPTEATLAFCEETKLRLIKRDFKPVGNSWESAERHIHRITAMTNVLKQNPKLIGKHEVRTMLYSSLAIAMKACTASRQPETGLILLNWVENSLFPIKEEDPSFAASMARIFQLVGGESSASLKDDIEDMDPVAAETIMARRWARTSWGHLEGVDPLRFFQEDNKEAFRLTLSSSMVSLSAAGRKQEALNLFYDLPQPSRTPDMYMFVAKYHEAEKDWAGVLTLYEDACKYGCASEELGSIAMKAITLAEDIDRLTSLRDIIDDMAKLSGIGPVKWMESRYWHLKRLLGFNTVRKLLFWQDNTPYLDELQLAIEELSHRKKAGLRSKNEGLRAIIRFAKRFEDGIVPASRRELGLVPRTAKQMVGLVCLVLDDIVESSSSLRSDRFFLSDLYDVICQLLRISDPAAYDDIQQNAEINGKPSFESMQTDFNKLRLVQQS